MSDDKRGILDRFRLGTDDHLAVFEHLGAFRPESNLFGMQKRRTADSDGEQKDY